MGTIFILLSFVALVALVIGLVKPSIVKVATRGKAVVWYGGGFIVLLILGGATSAHTETTTPIVAVPQTQNNSVTPEPIVTASAPAVTTPKPTSNPAPKPAPVVTPAPKPQTNNQNTSPVSSETVSQKNAIRKAKSYLGYSAFSHDGLVEQLEYEHFSHADAVYGADNSGANWNEQAAKKAKSYMAYSAYSRGSLIEQLLYEKFTQSQAEYGANSVGL